MTYTASAYVDTHEANAFAPDGGVFLKVLNSSNAQIAQGIILASKTNPDVDNGWQRITVTFTPSTGGNYSLCVQWKNADGTIRVDDVQLEAESAPSSYNHIYNASFENGEDGWVLTDFDLEHISDVDKKHGAQSFRANGCPDTKIYAQQTIPLGKSSDTTFLLSG